MALLCGGGYAEYVSVPEELLMPVPSNLTMCQAAAIPEAWLTAFQLLDFVGITNISVSLCFSSFLYVLMIKIRQLSSSMSHIYFYLTFFN